MNKMAQKKWIITLLLTLTIISMLAITACDSEDQTETATIPSPTPPITESAVLTNTTHTIEPNATLSLPSLADMIADVYPSVVTINTQATSYNFFYGQQITEGAGSGWIFQEDGIIVTNNHVVEGAQTITVGLADGRAFEAKKVYGDAVSDLAIVKIDADNLPALTIGDSARMRVGEWVVAIGNPLGYGLRAKEGIISGMNVSLSPGQGETLFGLLETSAAINPGNSGGPLVNLAGEVIGINSAKISDVGVEGMGYAICTNTALPIITELIEQGYVSRPWIGAETITVNSYVAMLNRLAVNEGAVISQIISGSPAAKAGLTVFDVITKFNDQKITSASQLDQLVRASQIGQEVDIRYVRGRNTQTTTLTLGESPKP